MADKKISQLTAQTLASSVVVFIINDGDTTTKKITYENLLKGQHRGASSNTFFGGNAGNDAMTGTGNTGFGLNTFTDNTTGNNNTSFGSGAGHSNTEGSNNTSVGKSSAI